MASIKGKIWAHYNEYAKEWGYTINDTTGDMSDVGWVLIKEVSVDYEVPPYEVLVAGTIEGWRKELQAVRARAYVEERQIEEKIQNLLCLENKPAAAEVDFAARDEDDIPF